jgi:endoribonuclease Dicer
MIGSQFVQDQSLDHLVRIMNEFYHVTDPFSRPRVLALVASSTPRRFQYDSVMLELEIALDAKVSGVSSEKRTEILSIPDTPSETVILYNPALRTTVTRLTEELLKLDPGEVMVPHHFRASRLVLAELGSCASDLVWRKAVGRIEATVHPSLRMLDDSVDQSDVSDPSAKMRICDAIKNWALEMPKLNPNSRGFNVTPKFLKLIQILQSYESYGEEFRGIVFGASINPRSPAVAVAHM